MGIKAKLVILKLMPLHQVACILTIYGRYSKLCKSLLKMRTGDFRSSRQPHGASITRYQHCKMLFLKKRALRVRLLKFVWQVKRTQWQPFRVFVNWQTVTVIRDEKCFLSAERKLKRLLMKIHVWCLLSR